MKKNIEIVIILIVIFLAFIPIFIGQINFPINTYKVSSLYQNLSGVKNHGYSISYQDILYNTYPWAKQDQAAIKKWTVPLWQFSNLAGYPLLGNDQSQFFFPLIMPLLYITSFVSAISIEAFLKIVLLSIGGYLFVSLYTKRSISKIIGSLLIALNGFATMWLLWPISSAFIFIPFILWIIEKSYREDIPYKYTIFFISIFVALELLSGSLDISLVFSFAIILFLIFIIIRERKIKKLVLLSIFIGAIIGLLISMIQIYPVIIDLLRSYYFHIRISYQQYDVLKYSDLLKFIYPGIFGVPWANSLPWVAQNFSETSFFIGLPAFYLGIIAFSNKLGRKYKLSILLLFLIIILIITGTIPFSYLIQIPIIKNTLYHRMEGFLPVLYSVLVVFGIDAIYKALSTGDFSKIKKYTYIFSISIVGLSTIIILKILFTIHNTASMLQSLKSILFQDLITFIFILSIFFIKSIKTSEKNIKICLAFIILIFCITPLILINYRYWQYTSSNNLVKPTNKDIKIFSKNKDYRVLSTSNISPAEVNVLAGFNEFDAYDPVVPAEYYNFYKLIGKKNNVINFSYSNIYKNSLKYLQIASIKYILLSFKSTPPNGTVLMKNHNLSNFINKSTFFLKKYNIYSKHNLDALYYLAKEYHINHGFENRGNVVKNIKTFLRKPNILYVNNFEKYTGFYRSLSLKYNTQIESILKINIPYFLTYKVENPLKIVYQPKKVYQYSSSGLKQLKKMQSIKGNKFAVTSVLNSKLDNSHYNVLISNYNQGNNEIKFNVLDKYGKSTFISIEELYYPGWVAYDNGKKINLYRSNSIFDGIIVKNKNNDIVLKYQPANFNKGIDLSLLGILILFVVIFI